MDDTESSMKEIEAFRETTIKLTGGQLACAKEGRRAVKSWVVGRR
jgi:uncharacterized protein YlzI (FlbEa/FlbD family)